jgi:parallel beta-helix repeat protein
MKISAPNVAYPVLVAAVIGIIVWANAGSLTPPVGPITPTMKDLDTVEPRIPLRAADLPKTISAPGSYYLVEDVPAASGGITIASDDVTIDLMGHRLEGTSGDGIVVTNFYRNLEVRNGVIRDWPASGIDATLLNNGRFENLRISGTGTLGMIVGTNTVITGCTVVSCGGVGITVGSAGVIAECTAVSNGGHGIAVLNESTITNCNAKSNVGNGIDASGEGNSIIGCSATFNTGRGISALAGGTITACSTQRNGTIGIFAQENFTVSNCTSNLNTTDNIFVIRHCLVLNNNCRGKQANDAGIRATSAANRIEGNNVTHNTEGIAINFAGNIIVKNTATTNGTNYNITAGNSYGPIFIVAGAGDISTVAGGASHPWTNFSY